MNRTLTYIHNIFFSVLLSVCSLNAKEFRILALDETPFRTLETFDFSTSQVVQVPISTKHASPKFKVPSNNTVQLYEKYPIDGSEVAPVLSLNFNGQSEDTLILLKNDPADSSKLKCRLVDCSPKSFPGGSILVINTCKKSIIAKFKDKIQKFPAKNSKYVQLVDPEDSEGNPFSGPVKFAGPLNGKLEHFVSTIWYIPSSLKQVIILSENRQKGRYELKKVNIY